MYLRFDCKIKPHYSTFVISCLFILNSCVITHTHTTRENQSPQAPSTKLTQVKHSRGKNIILFLGDGMGISTVTAARIFAGQQQGKAGEEHQLSFERFPHLALSKTYNTDQQVPDSAGTMSAIVTGIKTRAGVLSVQAEPARGDCLASKNRGATTILELAELIGMKTGIISTARITHATPGATYSHVPERGWENDSELPESAQSANCKDIARQLIEFPFGDGIELVLGGGRANFLPKQNQDPEYADLSGWRNDGRDLTQEWQSQRDNAQYVWNLSDFSQALSRSGPILGLFEPSHMQYEHDRQLQGSKEPSLAAMTQAAIQRLDNEKGYFLLVEGGRIDHGHHANNAYRALSETVALSDAVAAAVKLTNPEETLILVTADHSHVFTMAGYPSRGNPILGLVHGHDGAGHTHQEPRKAADGLPYTTLAYANGPGHLETGRGALSAEQVRDPEYLQYSGIPKESETHGGEDVAVYAYGPGSHAIHGVMEQNEIFYALIGAQEFLYQRWRQIQQQQGWPVDPKQLIKP